MDALFADLLADDPPLRPRGPVGGIITAAFASGAALPVAKASAPPACVTASSAAQATAASALRPAALPCAMTAAGHKEVTVTTTKDFAGQLVHGTRTVAVGSDEHKKLMQVRRDRLITSQREILSVFVSFSRGCVAAAAALSAQAVAFVASEAEGHWTGVGAGSHEQSEKGSCALLQSSYFH